MELPHYQLIPFLGMTLKYTGSELATVQKLSERVNQQTAGQSSIKASINALEEIVTAENFEGVEEDNGDRYTRPGQITIITMHKAKGLDWDYVFIPFLHDDILPGQPWIPKAGQFLGNFTLSEVARAQIRAIVHHQYLASDRSLTIPLPDSSLGRSSQAQTSRRIPSIICSHDQSKTSSLDVCCSIRSFSLECLSSR